MTTTNSSWSIDRSIDASTGVFRPASAAYRNVTFSSERTDMLFSWHGAVRPPEDFIRAGSN